MLPDHIHIKDVSRSELYWRIPKDAKVGNWWQGNLCQRILLRQEDLEAHFEAELRYEG